jgi:hypothetical protein
MRRLLARLLLFPVVLLAPAAAYAQASLTGRVMDASGAVLPGVTVEAASPALIEKVRTSVTDGTGQYRIELLPPGAYTVTFSLTGFSIVRREGVELTGTFTATIDAELRVGTVEETITVTGETPIVDVQSATRQRVVDRELIDSLPTGRSPFALTNLIPGVTATTQDLGGAGSLQGGGTQIHGSSGASQLLMENGLSTAAFVTPAFSLLSFNLAAAQEVTVDYAGAGAETNQTGIRVNVIPREGGNTFNGTLFVNGATSGMSGNNFSDSLRKAGLRSPDAIRQLYEINPGFGGPLQRDRVWFYFSGRRSLASRFAADEFYAKGGFSPSVRVYEPDLDRPVANDSELRDARLRLTWQAAPKVKIGGQYVDATTRNWPNVRDTQLRGAGATLSAYEASTYNVYPVLRQATFDVTSPLTSRLLVDGAVRHFFERSQRDPVPGIVPGTIGVIEQSTGREYGARNSYNNRPSHINSYRAAVSYITGAHSFKVGAGDIFGHFRERFFDVAPLSYRFSAGVPNLITMRAYPIEYHANINHQFGAYAQDRWTIDRLTLNVGLRYDWFQNTFPAQTIGPAPLAPARNVSFDQTDGLSLHDLSPKLSAAYDLRGDQRTALKVSLNRYVEPYTTAGIAGARNPINRLANVTTRSWTDSNRDYVPDCDLLNFNGNGECGAVANRLFGSATPEQNFDPETLEGWGNRTYNWELTGGVQHELLSGISADVTYFRRWYGNLHVVDNRAVTADDFTPFGITAPSDSRLPNGGDYAISGLYDVVPAKFGLTDNFTTFANNFGEQVQMWNGVALTLNARLPNGILLQGGLDTGRLTNDTCEIRSKLPELVLARPTATDGNLVSPTLPYCKTSQPTTQFKLLGSYRIPRIDVQVSGTFQSLPGPEIQANFVATNAIVTPSLGRSLAGTAQNVSVNLVEPGTMYGERLNQLDLRVGKMVQFGKLRATVNLDLYNALNVDTVLAVNNAYATWQQPTSILLARFAKIGVQLDF